MVDGDGIERRRFQGEWADRAVAPDDPAYLADLAYEDQQIAFWNAYSDSTTPPGELLNLNPARTDAGLLDHIGRQRQRANAAEGELLAAVGDYAFRRMAEPVIGYDLEYMRRSVEAEVAVCLKLSPAAASSLVHLAMSLRSRLPKTLAALKEGVVSRRAAETIADESADLNVAQCAQLEDAVLPSAADRSQRSLQNFVQKQVADLDADAVRKRAEKAKDDRCLYVKPGHDGMATLCAVLPAGVAQGIFDAITDKVLAAQASAKAAHRDAQLVLPSRDDRNLGAQRVDELVDLLAAGLGVDLWAPVVEESSFLTEEQIADLNKTRAPTSRPRR